jgi:hypothetical protein
MKSGPNCIATVLILPSVLGVPPESEIKENS